MKERPFEQMDPWYKGWKGDINENGPLKYDVIGTHEFDSDDDTCTISEIPVGKSTQDYKKFLEELENQGDIDGFEEHHAKGQVEFLIYGDMEALKKKSKSKGGVEKFLKLRGSIATSNMVLFDHEKKIYKYQTAEDIMKAWFDLRQDLYVKRKAW